MQCSHLPAASQDVLFHPLFGQLFSLHISGVLFEPGVLKTLSAGQPGPTVWHLTGLKFRSNAQNALLNVQRVLINLSDN